MNDADRDTEDINLLERILEEVRDLRQETDERLTNIEREVELIRHEQQRLGSVTEEIQTHCRERLEFCQGRRKTVPAQPSPIPRAIEPP